MAKKLKVGAGRAKASEAKAREHGRPGSPDITQVIRESAHEIWLAGLGAYARAQEEGVKVFDALVKVGKDMQKNAPGIARSQWPLSQAGGAWSKLEQVFEDRVARSLGRLGVPTKHEVNELSERIDALNRSVEALLAQGGKPEAGKPARRSGAKPAAKPRRRKAAPEVTASAAGEDSGGDR